MNVPPDSASGLGLQFFGVMTASISHELKNVLAIVNENAGLLSDLVLMAEKGRPLDPARLNAVAAKTRQQVQRADTIIKRLNQFAHSAYDPAALIGLNEVVASTIALTARLAAMKNISITATTAGELKATVDPFQLQNLLWLCLQPMLATAQGNQTVTLSCEDRGTHAAIVMCLDAGLSAASVLEAAATGAAPLLEALQATLTIDSNNAALVITLPKQRA